MGSPLRLAKSPGVLIAVLTTLSLGIVGFGTWMMLRSGQAPTQAEQDEAVVETVDRRIAALGRIEPEGGIYKLAPPSTRNGGNSRVLRVLARKGAVVQKGQPLAVMDSYDTLRADVLGAEALVREAQAQLAQVKAGAKDGDIQAQIVDVDARQSGAQVLEAALNSAKARAARVEAEAAKLQRDAQRFRQLFKKGAVSEIELDSRELALVTKVRELEQAQREIEQAEREVEQAIKRVAESAQRVRSVSQVRPEDVAQAETQVQTALVNLERAKIELNTAAVISPIDGQVLEVHAEDGEAVGAQGIMDLAQTQVMNVIAEVYETDIQDIRPGQAAAITSSVLKQPLSGRVKSIGLKINKKDVLNSDPVADTDARIVEVEIRLDDPKPVASLTNLQVNVAIDTDSGIQVTPDFDFELEPKGQGFAPGGFPGGNLGDGSSLEIPSQPEPPPAESN